MAIGRISGSVLKSNLTRNGVDLAFETNLLYLDVTNSRVGIGTSEPTTALQVAGTITATAFAGDGSNLTGINVDTNIQIVGDDSTGATLGTGETFKIAGGTNITTAVSGDTLTVTGPDLSSYITASSTDTLTNKTFDANGTGNSISNLEVADFAGSAMITVAETLASNDSDTALVTAGAIIDYVDAQDANIGSDTLTFTNKTFDANGTGNSLSNVEVADFASGVVDTDISSASASDDTLASAKAIKSYVDAQVTAQDLDFQADTGGALAIDLDSETLTFTGSTGIDTSGSGNTVTFAIDSTVTTNSGTQTLTNKTLTNPTINAATFTGDVTASGNVDFDSGTLFINATTNRVGVGSSTLYQPFTVHNTTSAQLHLRTANPGIRFSSDVAGNSDATRGFIGFATNNDAFIQGSAIGDLVLRGKSQGSIILGDSSGKYAKFVDGGNLLLEGSSITFEGSTPNTYETTLAVTDPTADRTITLPNATGTVVLKDTTDTLTNKTINLSDNTLTGTTAQFNSALSDGSFATLVGSETLTNKTINTANNTITIVEADISDLGSYITASSTDTLTNKTFDANGTGNSISNIEVADFAAGVLDTDLSSVSASDDTLASAKAIKTYIDTQVTAQDLDFQADSGGALSVDLDSQTFTITGGTGIDTAGSGQTLTVNIDSTVATLTGTQTLSGKTLTTPTINGATMTGTVTVDSLSFADNTITTNASNANLELTASGTGTVEILTNTNVTGTQTITNTTTNDSLTITTTEDSSTAAPVITLKRNSSSPADADYLGQINFKGENDADQEVNYAGITGKILDASDGTEDGIIEFSHIKAGSSVVTGRWRSDGLQLLNGTNLTVAGDTTVTGSLIADGLSYPTSDGSAGQVLKTDGSGTLSFTTISTNSVSQGDSNVTVTDSGTGAVTVAADGGTIITMNATTVLDASAVTNAIRLPNGTTAQRPSGAVGEIRYNSSTDAIEGYTTSGGWAQLGATSSTAENTDDTLTGNSTAISTTEKIVNQFTTSSFDSAWYLAVTRDEINDQVSTAKHSLAHNNSAAVVSTSHITRSDATNSFVTVDADVTGGNARLKATGASVVNSVSFYRIALGNNTTAGTTGNVTTVINTDVDSASESIDSWAKASYRAAKYYISVNNASKTEVTNMEALVVHDGTTAFITAYGVTNTGSNDLVSLTAAVDGDNVVVSAQGNEPNLRVTSYRILLADGESGSSGDNVNVVAATTVSSTATTVDSFVNSAYTGAFYVFTGYNSTEGSASATEVMVVSNDDVYVSTGPAISTKGTDQLEFSATQSGSTVTVKAASTSGASTTVNGYRVHMLRGSAGASTADTVLVSTEQTITGAKTFSNAVVMMTNLPTSDPNNVGQLWNDSGTLKISAG